MPTLAPCVACGQPAAWRCARCGDLCAAHVGRLPGRFVRFRCGECRGDAQLLRVHRSELERFSSRIASSLRAPVEGRGILALLVGVVAMLPIGRLWPWILPGGALALAAGVVLARRTAEGAEFDWPAPARFLEEVAGPLGRAAAALAPVWVLLLMMHGLRTYQIMHGSSGSLAASPLFWLATVLACAWIPAALVHSLTASAIADAAGPAGVVAVARRHPREWGTMAGVALGLALFALGAAALTPPTWAGIAATCLASVWGLLTLCCLAGALVYLHADDFGWGEADEAMVDLGNPDAPALAEEKPKTTPAPAKVPARQRLVAALDAKNARLALQILGEVASPGDEFDDALLLRIGQAAASLSEYSVAVNTLMLAGRGSSADSAKALVVAARILDERLRDTFAAKRLFRQVQERFPGTPAGDFAAKTLKEPRFLTARKDR